MIKGIKLNTIEYAFNYKCEAKNNSSQNYSVLFDTDPDDIKNKITKKCIASLTKKEKHKIKDRLGISEVFLNIERFEYDTIIIDGYQNSEKAYIKYILDNKNTPIENIKGYSTWLYYPGYNSPLCHEDVAASIIYDIIKDLGTSVWYVCDIKNIKSESDTSYSYLVAFANREMKDCYAIEQINFDFIRELVIPRNDGSTRSPIYVDPKEIETHINQMILKDVIGYTATWNVWKEGIINTDIINMRNKYILYEKANIKDQHKEMIKDCVARIGKGKNVSVDEYENVLKYNLRVLLKIIGLSDSITIPYHNNNMVDIKFNDNGYVANIYLYLSSFDNEETLDKLLEKEDLLKGLAIVAFLKSRRYRAHIKSYQNYTNTTFTANVVDRNGINRNGINTVFTIGASPK